MAYGWHKVKLDGSPSYWGYLDPEEDWNGAACPYFDIGEAFSINPWLYENLGERLEYDPANDSFTCRNNYEVLEVFKGKDVDYLHLYPIGSGSWCWELEE